MTLRTCALVLVVAVAVLLGAAAGTQPATAEAGGDPDVFVVQSFLSGRLSPLTGEDGTAALAFPGPIGDALYFGERPGREVGSLSIEDLPTSVREAEADPPNAALVASLDDGGEMQAVVELLGGDVDADGAVTDRLRLLGMADHSGIALEEDAPADLAGAIVFGSGQLFIDGLGQHKDNPT